MVDIAERDPLGGFEVGQVIGRSEWLEVNQPMINAFGAATLDPDPMHVDPDWARRNGPFGGTIAFGFLTVSLLTRLLYSATGADADRDPAREGYHLNYGFDRLRLAAPVPVDRRVQGRFTLLGRRQDERGRRVTTIGCVVETEGGSKPALVADWLFIWIPPES